MRTVYHLHHIPTIRLPASNSASPPPLLITTPRIPSLPPTSPTPRKMSRASELCDDLNGLHLHTPTAKPHIIKTPPPSTLSHPSTPPPHSLLHTFDKAATVFPSHVRATFRRIPSDRTGELVRLLDDISTVTHSISSYVTGQLSITTSQQTLDPEVATQKLYASLCHDGYACAILERTREAPLAFKDSALHGGYVVMLSSLDIDPNAQDHVVCGTIFSVYKRKSQPSLPGRLKDLQQQTAHQVAAGYVLYSSATTLTYTMGVGVYSFVLHPVATQYFLQPVSALTLPQNGSDLHVDYEKARQDSALGASAILQCTQRAGTLYDSGCITADFHAAISSGSLFVRHDLHLLCEAAPLAFLTEQLGGKATDGAGNRILDFGIQDEDVHKKVNFCSGPIHLVDAVEIITPKPSTSSQ